MQKIKCTIKECEHHEEVNNCKLSEINIGTHEVNPTEIECTDCQSFKLKCCK